MPLPGLPPPTLVATVSARNARRCKCAHTRYLHRAWPEGAGCHVCDCPNFRWDLISAILGLATGAKPRP